LSRSSEVCPLLLYATSNQEAESCFWECQVINSRRMKSERGGGETQPSPSCSGGETRRTPRKQAAPPGPRASGAYRGAVRSPPSAPLTTHCGAPARAPQPPLRHCVTASTAHEPSLHTAGANRLRSLLPPAPQTTSCRHAPLFAPPRGEGFRRRPPGGRAAPGSGKLFRAHRPPLRHTAVTANGLSRAPPSSPANLRPHFCGWVHRDAGRASRPR
jgi:hypothetical protein